MRGHLLHIILVGFSLTSYCQQHWQIKVDGGYSIPVSKYSKVDVSQSISIVDGYPVAEDFDKEGHAAAETGRYYTVTIKRLFLSNKLIASAGLGQGSNPVSTTEISNYYTDFLDDTFYYVFEQDDYKVAYGFLSLGYHVSLSNMSFTIEPLIGYSSLRYPDYKMTAYLDGTNEFRFDVTPRGPKENIGALLVGIQSSIDVTLLNRLTLGISMRYLSSDHDYAIELMPTGLDSRKDQDTVNYRAFNIGVSLGVLF